MTTDTNLTILVVVLAVTLGLFLILSIILVIKMIQVASSVKRISSKAEEVVDKAEAVTEFFENAGGPLALGRVVANIVKTVNNKKDK